MEKKVKNVPVLISIPEELDGELKFIAQSDCRTRNNLITKILSDFVKSKEAGKMAAIPHKGGS